MLKIIRFRHTTHHMWQHRSGLAMLAFWTTRLRPVVPKALFKAFRKVVLAGAASDRKSVGGPQFWSVPAEGWYPWRSKLLVRIMRQRMDFEDLFIYDIWTRVLHEGWMTYRCWPRQAQRMLRWNGSKRLCQKVSTYYMMCIWSLRLARVWKASSFCQATCQTDTNSTRATDATSAALAYFAGLFHPAAC